jgi:hypothetical protein
VELLAILKNLQELLLIFRKESMGLGLLGGHGAPLVKSGKR